MSRRASSASSRALANNLRCGARVPATSGSGGGLSSSPLEGFGVWSDAACSRVNDISRDGNMRKLIVAIALTVIRRHRGRAGADLSVASDHAHRPVPAGRIDRRGRAHHGRADAAVARPARRHRERRWRRRQHRRRARRPCGARRLHDRHRPVGHARRQHHLSPDLRSAEGFRADRADLHQSAADGRQEGPAGR